MVGRLTPENLHTLALFCLTLKLVVAILFEYGELGQLQLNVLAPHCGFKI